MLWLLFGGAPELDEMEARVLEILAPLVLGGNEDGDGGKALGSRSASAVVDFVLFRERGLIVLVELEEFNVLRSGRERILRISRAIFSKALVPPAVRGGASIVVVVEGGGGGA